jgi:hypothetical protein
MASNSINMLSRQLTRSGLLALVFGLGSTPVRALEPQEVDAKFADIVILTPATTAGQPRVLEGVGMVALFSPQAASDFDQRWRQRSGAVAGEGPLRFVPLKLMAFEAAYLKTRETKRDLGKVYLPDPTEIPAAVALLQQQGAPADKARDLARREPFVFCPDPLVRVSTKDSSGKSSTRVPCSLSFVPIALLVNRTTTVLKRPTVVRAFSLEEMVQFLRTQNGDDARNLMISSPLEAIISSGQQPVSQETQDDKPKPAQQKR